MLVCLLYFSDYKAHTPQIWEEMGGMCYSLNVVYLAGGVDRGRWRWWWSRVFFPCFPPLNPRYVLWSGASYSPKNTVYFFLSLILMLYSWFQTSILTEIRSLNNMGHVFRQKEEQSNPAKHRGREVDSKEACYLFIYSFIFKI